MKIVVTGAAGFIGSHLCERLVKAGYSVIGVDNFDPFYDPAVKRRNLAGLMSSGRFQLAEGDIRDAALMESAAAGAEAVIHLAAKAGVRPSVEDPAGYADVNVRGTTVVLEAARKAGIQKFLFASSSSVYGNRSRIPFSEDEPADAPISPYAATKRAGELLCYTYHHLYGMDVSCLRFFTVYGPRQRPDLAICKFARLIEAGRPIPVYGDGSAERDFTYIDDIIDGVLAALERCRGYRIYNLGESCPVRLDDLIGCLEEALGKKAVRQSFPPQPGEVQRTCADIRRAAAELGFRPKTPLREGLARFVEWMRAERRE
ncbi:MAG TPA: GDP-mannose 4,6-dehydratase [Anaerohalosphaeraceae bacterium]|nr:GDP-mannose 4,6-dehydratase [Anaerohalosphaeraceae bacterium]HQJ67918.1 GDP-mannose 4,6-dehydratase [Anaerohalosphaeraceae bacterium]